MNDTVSVLHASEGSADLADTLGLSETLKALFHVPEPGGRIQARRVASFLLERRWAGQIAARRAAARIESRRWSGQVFEAPDETNELMPFTFTLDGVAQTSGVVYSITDGVAESPGGWTAAEMKDGRTHARVSGLAPGHYRVWAKMTAGTETPVVDCGVFRIK